MTVRPPRRILVVMLRRIGDVLLTTPAVRALKKLFPDAEIDFLVEPPADQLLIGNPDIARVRVYGKGIGNTLRWIWTVRRARYDMVIDYMGNPRTAALTYFSGARVCAGPGHVSHRWAYSHFLRQSDVPYYSAQEKIRVLRSLGLAPDESDVLLSLNSDAAAEESADTALRRMRLPAGRLIGLFPASRRTTRRWPAGHYAALARGLREKTPVNFLVFWGPGERALAEEVRVGIGDGAYLAPETPRLRELAALIGRCTMAITNCNGPKHIAVARGVPTLTIHGSSDPLCWNPPDQELHPTVRAEELPCIGCMKNVCPFDLECMKQLTPQRVLPQALRLLAVIERSCAAKGSPR